MSRVLTALLLGAALLLASTPPGVTQEESADAIPDRLSSAVADSPDGEFVPGRLLVKTTEDEDLEAANRRLCARTEGELPDLDIEVIEFSPSRPVEDVAAAYEREPGVEYAEPDFVRRLAAATRVAARALDPAQLDLTDPLEKRLAEKLAVEEQVRRRSNGGSLGEPGVPFADPCPPGAREVIYNVSVMQRDIVYNEAGWHDTQGRFLVFDKNVPRMLARNPDDSYKNQPEPLFVRVNAGDCVNFNLTNLLPNWFGGDAFVRLAQTNMMGQHIHLVKFDVLASDGFSNGWNYQQAAFTEERINFNRQVASGQRSCGEAGGCTLPNPATWNPSWSGGVQPGQTIRERWYADYELRTAFSHDHHFPAVDQNRGQFAGLLVEPAGMNFRNPKTGEFYQPGNVPGAPRCPAAQGCEGTAAGSAMDVIGPGARDVFREYGLAYQDFVSLTRAGGNPANRNDVFVGPNAPESYPDEDPGIVGINYRNAPFPIRQERDGSPSWRWWWS